MELVDCHTHTSYSDGVATVEENVARAAELRLATICCTDHLTLPTAMDPDCACSVPEADLPSYMEDVLAARARHPEIEVVLGFECDYYPGCEANVARWRAGATFLLGSVHALDGSWIDDLSDLSYWDAHATEEVWTRYFAVWEQACASACGFDSMAHPDLVSLLGRFPDAGVRTRLYAHAAQVARDAGVRVEVNTAGACKPVGRFYPDSELLSLFARAGVPVTVGSDAHVVSRVGEGIMAAYRLAYGAGCRSIDVPTADGGWRRVSIEP